AMSRFASEHISTIIWPGGYETQFSKAATAAGYQPEWITAGDGAGEGDGIAGAGFQDQSAWAHAVVVTPLVRIIDSSGVSQACKEAYESVDPSPANGYPFYACPMYIGIKQLFTGIQVA